MPKRTTTNDQANPTPLFDTEEYEDPAAPRRPITELRRIHEEGKRLLEPYTARTLNLCGIEAQQIVYRVRQAEDFRANPRRLFEVTVRYETPGHKAAEEWVGITQGDISHIVYGWLGERVAIPGEIQRRPEPWIEEYLLVDAQALLGCILERPRCITWAGGRSTHHAPGGASFLVVDVRRLPAEAVVSSTFRIEHEPAPVEEQQALL